MDHRQNFAWNHEMRPPQMGNFDSFTNSWIFRSFPNSRQEMTKKSRNVQNNWNFLSMVASMHDSEWKFAYGPSSLPSTPRLSRISDPSLSWFFTNSVSTVHTLITQHEMQYCVNCLEMYIQSLTQKSLLDSMLPHWDITI